MTGRLSMTTVTVSLVQSSVEGVQQFNNRTSVVRVVGACREMIRLNTSFSVVTLSPTVGVDISMQQGRRDALSVPTLQNLCCRIPFVVRIPLV